MSLSDCKVDENEEEKTELGIWRTNNFALGKNLSSYCNIVTRHAKIFQA